MSSPPWPARPRVLGGRCGPRQTVTVRWPEEVPAMSAVLKPPPWKPTPVIPQPRKWTAVEFDQLGSLGCFAGRRAFLLDGVILEQGPMDPPHANALELVTEAVRTAFGPG